MNFKKTLKEGNNVNSSYCTILENCENSRPFSSHPGHESNVPEKKKHYVEE